MYIDAYLFAFVPIGVSSILLSSQSNPKAATMWSKALNTSPKHTPAKLSQSKSSMFSKLRKHVLKAPQRSEELYEQTRHS